MDKRVTEHLQRLLQYINELEDISRTPENGFVESSILVAATERNFQLAIETCINIGNRILSIEQFNVSVNAPESYADIFIQLVRIGIIDKDLSESMINMARFRNRLVHVYWDVDPGTIYNYLNNNLGDFHSFIKAVNNYYTN